MKNQRFQHLANIFFTTRSYWVFGGIVAWFVVTSHLSNAFFYFGFGLIFLFVIALLFEVYFLVLEKGDIQINRNVDQVLSLGDVNLVSFHIKNNHRFNVNLLIVDETPKQLQLRDFEIRLSLYPNQKSKVQYEITPMTRGKYQFGDIYVFVQRSFPGLINLKQIVEQNQVTKVYPSIIHMREAELKIMSKLAVIQGVKRMRRLGHSYEFEQIKAYVEGDDYRSINWKATGRKQTLMINQYEDERSQPLYFIIDKGRNMKMPFEGLSLIDYAVNSTLALSNIAIKKGDKVGLITFDKKLETLLKPSNKRSQLSAINETLYNLQQEDVEPSFEDLYMGIGFYVKQRSLLFLFTNCNTVHSLNRIKPALALLNKTHLVVVILFENTEIVKHAALKPNTLEEVYENTIAEEFLYDQQQIALDLNAFGIQTIVSAPQALTVNTINKYLSLKSQGKH